MIKKPFNTSCDVHLGLETKLGTSTSHKAQTAISDSLT